MEKALPTQAYPTGAWEEAASVLAAPPAGYGAIPLRGNDFLATDQCVEITMASPSDLSSTLRPQARASSPA